MAKRPYLLRYWLEYDTLPSRRCADFECTCGWLEVSRYLGDCMRYRKDCPHCHGSGRYVRQLTRREQHVLKVYGEQLAKANRRTYQRWEAW